jgi:predicted nucleotidyltransferase
MEQAVKAILAELKRRVEDLYGERLARVVLYGSQARGDAADGSDIDVLIVLQGETSPCEEIARTADLTAELSLRHNVVIVPAFVSEDRYQGEQSPLLLNVRREGVPV